MIRVLVNSQSDAYPFLYGLFRRDVILRNSRLVSFENTVDVNVLVVADPTFPTSGTGDRGNPSSFNDTKIIQELVKSGKGLFLHSTDNLNSRINQLSKVFGVMFNADRVKDEKSCVNGLPDIPLIRNFEKHDITDGINVFSYPLGCSLDVDSSWLELAFSGKDSNVIGKEKRKGSSLVLAARECEKGRVVALGSGMCFNYYFMEDYDNRKLLGNIVEWLSYA